MSTPPIPARLADRPTKGGLVVPWISLETDRGHHLGSVSDRRWRTCVLQRRCQICGETLGRRHVMFFRSSDVALGYTAEPAMHPECAAYSAKACPMVNGGMDHYRSTPLKIAERTCSDPDCRCEVLPAPDSEIRAGAPAERFSAVWAGADDYNPAADGQQKLLGVAYPRKPLKVRPLLHEREQAAKDLMTKGGST